MTPQGIPAMPTSGGIPGIGANAIPPMPSDAAPKGGAPVPPMPTTGGIQGVASVPQQAAAPKPASSLLRDTSAALLSNVQNVADIGKTLYERATDPQYATHITGYTRGPRGPIPNYAGAPVPQAQVPGVTNFVNNTNPQGLAGSIAYGAGAMLPMAAFGGVGAAGEGVLAALRAAAELTTAGATSGAGGYLGAQVAPLVGATPEEGAIGGGLAGGFLPALPGGALRAIDRGMAESLPITQSQKAQNVASRLANAGVDMKGEAAKIDPNDVTGVGGVLKNTAQAANSTVLAKFNFVAQNDPRFNGPLNALTQQQAAARAAQVENLSTNEIDPASIKESVANHLGALQDSNAPETATLQQNADNAISSIGNKAKPEELGRLLRENIIQPGMENSGVAAGRMFDAIDPDGRAALDVSQGRKDIYDAINGERVPNEPISAPELRVNHLLNGWQDVIPFSQAKVFRTKLNDAISDTDDRNVKRKLLNGLNVFDNMIAGNVADTASKPPVAGSESPGSVVAAPTDAYTPNGQSVGVKYVVRDAGDLIASHNAEGDINPAYPQELQPRDRSRAASTIQINKMAANLKPQMLGFSHSSADGAPIVGPDGVVESGNGRLLAIQKAYDLNHEKATEYKSWLNMQGFDTTGMDRPVLVRERTTPLNPGQRVNFARESNMSSLAPMSKAEQAKADAKQISGPLLQELHPSSPTSLENRGFVQKFIKAVASPQEAGSFLTRDGDLSIEGANRVRHALLAKAYPDDHALIDSLTENDDPDVRALGNGLMEGAPSMAKLQSAIERGDVPAEKALAPAVKESLALVSKARRASVKLSDMVAQQDAFEKPSELSEAFLRSVYGDNFTKRVARNRVGGVLQNYAETAVNRGRQPDIFGVTENPVQLLKEASESYDRSGKIGGVSQPATGRLPPSGASRREAGDVGNAPRFGLPTDNQSGEGVDLGEGRGTRHDEATIRGQPVQDIKLQLRPNWTPEMAAKYKAARAAWAQHAAFYFDSKTSPLAKVLKKNFGKYDVSDEQVASRILNTGATWARDYQTFRDALGGDAEAHAMLEQHLVNKLYESGAVKDGIFNEKKYEAFARKWQPKLENFPVLKSKFENAASAQAAVSKSIRDGQKKLKDFQKSTLGMFIGPRDPETIAGSVLMKDPGTAWSQMRQIKTELKKFPAANDAWREAVANHLVNRFVRNAAIMKPETFMNFIETQQRALAEVLGHPAISDLKQVADEMRQDQRFFEASKAKGISDTARLTAAMKDKGPKTIIGKVIAGINSKIGLGAYLGSAVVTHGASVSMHAMKDFGIGMAMRAVEKAAADHGTTSANKLLAEALADPVLFRTIAQKIPATKEAETAWRKGLLRAISGVYVGQATNATRQINQGQSQ